MGVAGKKKLVHCHNSRTKPGRFSGVLAEKQVVARVVAHVIATYTAIFCLGAACPEDCCHCALFCLDGRRSKLQILSMWSDPLFSIFWLHTSLGKFIYFFVAYHARHVFACVCVFVCVYHLKTCKTFNLLFC